MFGETLAKNIYFNPNSVLWATTLHYIDTSYFQSIYSTIKYAYIVYIYVYYTIKNWIYEAD